MFEGFCRYPNKDDITAKTTIENIIILSVNLLQNADKTIISAVVSIKYSSAESKYFNIYKLNYFPISDILEIHILAIMGS